MIPLLQTRYRLDAELGRGGMGVVYRALDLSLDRPVAVKMLLGREAGDQERLRLVTEALLTAKLTHPNIVAVYDAGEQDGQPYIVMELVEGQTLRQWLVSASAEQRLAQAAPIARQVCAALEYAHARRVIHRDLKPENIFLTHHNHVKLMDFGLAHATDTPRQTQEGALVGTLTYMAPEVITGEPPSPQSDLYAFGVVLYELATGRPPFEGNVANLLAAHLYTQPEEPKQRQPALSETFNQVILRLLEKEPANRPISASDVLSVLEASTDGDLPDVVRALRLERLVPHHNLPTHLTSFIGREKEMAELREKLTPRENALARLVTLTGAGGTGKTRLALKTAAALVPHFPDGVWLVEFAPLSDPALVPSALLAVLGLPEEKDRPPLKTLADYVQNKTILLVFDNCEHLIIACARLAETLLRAGENAWVLVTSREALGIPGETVTIIPSLTLPEDESDSQSESTRLFIERAQSAVPAFEATEDDLPHITRICRRLDGIPLAIELAAARVKTLRVEQIAARLDDRFRLLTGGSRTALPRQQTLRALIDWSYNLLSEPERALLRQLAVFMGGWTLEAAEYVCAADDLDLLDALEQLVNKSLVLASRSASGETRYSLLETIRQYAREKLFDTDDVSMLRQRHLEYFVKFAEKIEPQLFNANQLSALNQLEIDDENLRSALEWALSGDTDNAHRLGGTLFEYWAMRDLRHEGYEWLQKILAMPAPTQPVWQAKVLGGMGLMANLRGEKKGPDYFRKSWSVWQKVGNPAQIGYRDVLEKIAAITYYYEENRPLGHSLVEQGLADARAANDLVGMGVFLVRVANFADAEEQPDLSLQLFQEALSKFRAAGYPIRTAMTLDALGRAFIIRGDFETARACIQECLGIYHQMKNSSDVPECLGLLGDIELVCLNYPLAISFYTEALALARKLNDPAMLSDILSRLVQTFYMTNQPALVCQHMPELLAIAREKDWFFGIQVDFLLDFACLAEIQARPWQAVIFWATCEASLSQKVYNWKWGPPKKCLVEFLAEKLHAQLPLDEFEQAWQAGQKMTLEEALALAMEEQV